jgi:hypothetical protein
VGKISRRIQRGPPPMEIEIGLAIWMSFDGFDERLEAKRELSAVVIVGNSIRLASKVESGDALG